MLDAVAKNEPVFERLWRKNAYIEVAERIREKIFSEKLKLFERLPSERELAEQFGVSRVVVREAIRTLESNGLLTVKKGQKGGIFVAQDYERPIVDSIGNLLAGGEASLENLLEVRLLEPHAAARVAEIGTAAEVDALAQALAEAEREHGADQSIRHRFIDFHRQILRLAGNPLLSIVGETVVLVVYERVGKLVSADTTSFGLTMHQRLIEAFRQHEPETARQIMAEDIRSLSERFAQISASERRRAAGGPRPRPK